MKTKIIKNFSPITIISHQPLIYIINHMLQIYKIIPTLLASITPAKFLRITLKIIIKPHLPTINQQLRLSVDKTKINPALKVGMLIMSTWVKHLHYSEHKITNWTVMIRCLFPLELISSYHLPPLNKNALEAALLANILRDHSKFHKWNKTTLIRAIMKMRMMTLIIWILTS